MPRLEPQRVVETDQYKLILGDCREYYSTEQKIDAIATDPPYGIGAAKMNLGFSRSSRLKKEGWDAEAPDLLPLLNLQKPTIIWGMNYFSLPPSRMFLVWDKGNGLKDRSFAECEIAWSNCKGSARLFYYPPLENTDGRNKEHPTQKPVPLMQWCLGFIEGKIVFDPYMGAGSTGVACMRLGRKFVGCEINEHYFNIALERIEKERLNPQTIASVGRQKNWKRLEQLLKKG